MNDALRTELATLTAEIRDYDARVTDIRERMREPREMTEKRNRAAEIIFEIGE